MFIVFNLCSFVFTCVHLRSTCVLLVFTFVFTLLLLVFNCVHLCSTCVHLCSNCVYLCSLVFLLVWCFRPDHYHTLVQMVIEAKHFLFGILDQEFGMDL